MRTSITLLLCALVLAAAPASAQIRGFADVGATRFTAAQSFTAITGSQTGTVFGGGIEVELPYGLFANLRATQYKRDGERVFLFDGNRFDLGIKTTVTVTPVDVTGGYRLGGLGRLVPYLGAGVGWHRYRETSESAADGEDVNQQFRGYQLVGGAEFRLAPFIAAAVEAERSVVANALGTNPNSVSAIFDEHDLGGTTLRVKVVIGR